MKRREKALSHETFPHRFANTSKESQKNLNLLFALQRLAYPQLNRPIKMQKTKVQWRKLKK